MEEEGEGEKESRVNDTMEENKKFLRTLSSHEVCLTFTLFSMLNLVSKQFQKSTIIFIKRQTLFRQHLYKTNYFSTTRVQTLSRLFSALVIPHVAFLSTPDALAHSLPPPLSGM